MTPGSVARPAAALAALVLALTSRGDATVLALVLALAAWRPLPALTVAAALGSSAWRWGSTSLEDVAGAQAVLGPAGWVGPPLAAAGSWLGALALVLLAPALPRAVGGVAAGAAAAVVVAGPGPGDLWIRILAVVVATALVVLVARAGAGRRWTEPLAFVAGLGALALTAPDAPPVVAPSAATGLEGLAVAAATAMVAVVVGLHRPRPTTRTSGGGGAS